MRLLKTVLLSTLVLLASITPSKVVQSQAKTSEPPLDSHVIIKLAPLPNWLKQKFAGRTAVSCGVAPFGTDQKNVWILCYKDQKTKTAFAEFWEKTAKNQSRRLLRATLDYFQDNPLTDEYDHIRICWLFPARHAGPVISTVFRASDQQRIYTFEKGWDDPKPIIQDVEFVKGETSNAFDFNSIDERGIAQGMAFVEYHMTAPEDLFGENYFLYWRREQGWFPGTEKPQPKS